jgi:hypothetical protein
MTDALADLVRVFEKLNNTCSHILELLEFSMSEELEEILTSVFPNPRDRQIYQLTDGSRSTRDIGKIIGLDQKGISKLWTKWSDLGIVESVGKLKPYKAKYTLIGLATKHKLEKKRNILIKQFV